MMKKLSILTIIVLYFFSPGCKEKTDITPSLIEPSAKMEGVINDEIDGVPIVVYGNQKRGFFSVYKRVDENGKEYKFERSEFAFPDVFKDEDGEIWSAFGKNNEGNSLQGLKNLVGYWFVFPSFHKKILLKDGREIINPFFEKENSTDNWLIDKNFVFSGSIKDGIKSIDNPIFISATSKEFIDNDFYKSLDGEDLLTAVQIGNDIHLYPHKIMEYHEVVNDKIGDQYIAMSFCPLTGTSRAWNREIDGKIHEFGVSGLLYNNNLILYDRVTDSNWSQIFDQSVNGSFIGKKISTIEVWEVKVTNMLDLEGRINVLSTNTGIDYEYKIAVYGDYKYSDRISFPLSFSDNRIPPKERVIGVTVGEITKVYRFEDFNSE
ncbi:MAG: DUF3179 domain-containing protein [Cyclobacteriaceae bacterium]|nr:DUF3179 domain-containing protein [Cyclobacteriaceae bacterium]